MGCLPPCATPGKCFLVSLLLGHFRAVADPRASDRGRWCDGVDLAGLQLDLVCTPWAVWGGVAVAAWDGAIPSSPCGPAVRRLWHCSRPRWHGGLLGMGGSGDPPPELKSQHTRGGNAGVWAGRLSGTSCPPVSPGAGGLQVPNGGSPPLGDCPGAPRTVHGSAPWVPVPSLCMLIKERPGASLALP